MRATNALAPLGLALLAAAFTSTTALADARITIEGQGEVTAAPDTAFLTSGVTTQGASAREALDANSAAMAELIETLTSAGIARRDVQTSNFSVNPNYVYSDARDENGYTLPPRIIGYQVSNTVTVRVRALDDLGTILDRAVTVGANTINGVSFAVADTTELYDAARKAAFSDARRKAELYAGAAGVSLGDLMAITEGQVYTPPQPMMARVQSFDSAAAVPVEAGELTFSIGVTVSWDIED